MGVAVKLPVWIIGRAEGKRQSARENFVRCDGKGEDIARPRRWPDTRATVIAPSVRLKFDDSFRVDSGDRHNMRDVENRTWVEVNSGESYHRYKGRRWRTLHILSASLRLPIAICRSERVSSGYRLLIHRKRLPLPYCYASRRNVALSLICHEPVTQPLCIKHIEGALVSR